MRLPSTDYRKAKNTTSRQRPIFVASITTTTHRWLFSVEELTETERGSLNVPLWDGSANVGDGSYFNDVGVTGWGAHVLSFGTYPRTLTPSNGNIFASLTETQIGTARITFNNMGRVFTDILSIQTGWSFLAGTLEVTQGFPNLTRKDFQPFFRGRIIEEILTDKECYIIAEAT